MNFYDMFICKYFNSLGELIFWLNLVKWFSNWCIDVVVLVDFGFGWFWLCGYYVGMGDVEGEFEWFVCLFLGVLD